MILFLRFLAFTFKKLPRKCALQLGVWLARLAGLIFISKKKICMINLEIAFHDALSFKEKNKIISRMYANLGKNAVDFLRLPLLNKDNFFDLVTVEGEDHVKAARKQGKGLIGVTAHYGCWDIIPLYFAFKKYGPNFITKDIRNPDLNAFWMEYRTYGGVNPIFKKSSAREIISILKRNESLGFVIDQNMNSRSGVFVDFFGVKACTIDAPVKLAVRYGSPILPIFCVRGEDDSLMIRFEEPVDIVQGRTKKETIIRTTEKCSKILERYITERPDHWIWLHKRWKTRPDGEEAIYK